jgi:predicted dehydrogenase
MHVGIIGCGLIGQKRADSLPLGYLKAVADVSQERAQKLARNYPDVLAYSNWEELIQRDDINLIIVSTTNNWLAPITLAAIRAGKHVLVEKPAARNFSELDSIIDAEKKYHVKVMIGYNLRCHPAFIKAKEIIQSEKLGPLLYIRGRYGHGGRLGYEKEWRANPEISGGGELLDQGVHLIDLSRWFLGEFSKVNGYTHTYYWKMPVEDNGFIYLETVNRQAAWLQVSCTEWKNLFSFEIFCERGKLQVDGIGGSYGTERLTLYQMLPQMGPPETTIWEFPSPDNSWRVEFDEFKQAIEKDLPIHPNPKDAREVLKVVSCIYGN